MSRVYGTEAHRAGRHPVPAHENRCLMSVTALPPARSRSRHRRNYLAADLRRDLRLIAETAARIGSGVTLAALLVVAAAVGGLVDGGPAATDAPTVRATFGNR
jgi:hypothetical protein